MATRKTTRYWKENKEHYTKCLCYSDKYGLYTDTIPEGSNPSELLYRPQGYKGYVINKIEIPSRNVEITILTNFEYGSVSYHSAAVQFDNRRILDFELSKLYVLRNCSVSTLDVPLYSWDSLFEKIINAYNTASLENLSTSAIAYIDGLNDMLDKNEIVIKGNLEEKKSTQWKGDLLIVIFAGKKIRDLLRGFELAGTSDQIVVKHTLVLCTKYISKVKLLDLDFNDSRVSQISETMMLIHKFMCENKAGKEYLSMLLDKEL